MNNLIIPLSPGTPAPNFVLHQTSRVTLSLDHFAGRPVALAFYPTPFEPVSGEQLTLYQEFLPEIERLRAQVLGISADYAWRQQEFARGAGVTFPLLADMPLQGRVSQMYGMYRPFENATARALFVIDSCGVIRFGQAYPDLLNPGVDDLLTVLEGLNQEV